MARGALLIALAVGVAPIAGCAVQQHVPPLVIGRFDGAPSMPTFHRILGAARSAGYAPEGIDEAGGIFHVRARFPGENIFVVQCYADGYVQVVPTGGRVARDGDEYVVHPRLRSELVTFVQRLSEARGAP